MRTPVDVVVVGGGVVGLTTAVHLARPGRRVEVWAADPPEATTSAVAAAVWYPYRALPRDRVLAWSARSLEVFTALADTPGTGVVMTTVLERVDDPAAAPWWGDAVPRIAVAAREELPLAWPAALRLLLPVVEMPRYLPWLVDQLEEAGGRLVRRRLEHLDEAAEAAPTVVCCAGLGARQLVGDDTVVPVRGQVVLVENPGLERALLDQTDPDPLYVIPRSRDCVVGGTAEVGRWETAPDPATAQRLLARARAVEQRLHGAAVLDHRAGLRPVRHEVRVERAGQVVHCYGHGGAGVTLSWGSAEEVAALVG